MQQDNHSNNPFAKFGLPPLPLVEQVFDEIGFELKHFYVVSNLEEMRAKAKELGMDQKAVENFKETVAARVIQKDDGDPPDMPECQIILQYPLSDGFEESAKDRLLSWEAAEKGCMGLTDFEEDYLLGDGDEQQLVTFLILHEAGHHFLRHEDAEPQTPLYWQQELEADRWALQQMRKRMKPYQS